MIALVTLLAGGYRRSGFGRRVVVAIGGRGAAAGPALRGPRSRVQEQPELWPLMYLPVLARRGLRRALLVLRLSRRRRAPVALA